MGSDEDWKPFGRADQDHSGGGDPAMVQHTVDGGPYPHSPNTWLLAAMALALWLVRRYRATMLKSDADLTS